MKSIRVDVKRKNATYMISVGSGAVASLKESVVEDHPKKKVVLVTDTHLAKRFEHVISEHLSFVDKTITVEPGERAKSRETKQYIEDQLLGSSYGRDTVLIALGGGVIGDLVGYVASTYMRGIPVYHLPTTLLAMVDSSVGGKTGINTLHGKNLIGTVWQPAGIVCDTDFLKTLSDDEYACGLAEIIKIAVAQDNEFFDYLHAYAKQIKEREPTIMQQVVTSATSLKVCIISQDEAESGVRQVLNVGHTIGHAIEQYCEYKHKHGQCVAMGMTVEATIAEKLGHLSSEDKQKLIDMLEAYNLPTTIPSACTVDTLWPLMQIDKKAQNGEPQFVLLRDIGLLVHEQDKYSFPVEFDLVKEALQTHTS